MPTLQTLLNECDDSLLPILSARWGVDDRRLDREETVQALMITMLDPARVETVFDSLNDEQRAALQFLASSPDRKTNIVMFESLYGEIRRMGKGKIDKEKPHLKPQGEAEALYYTGLIGISTGSSIGGGLGRVVYVPDDLAGYLPLHKTTYSDLEHQGSATLYDNGAVALNTDGQLDPLEDDFIADPRTAETSLIDDMTTLLAYVRIHGAMYNGKTGVDDQTRNILVPHLLHEDDSRLNFMVEIAISGGMLEVKDRHLTVLPMARSWLDEKRSAQIKRLVDVWISSKEYRELWHVPGLQTEIADGYDPVSARKTLLDLLRIHTPADAWWSIGDFIDVVHNRSTDFQRPGGDYDSWYIRNSIGDYLRGLESWDAVEGATIEFYLTAPLHWLCLVDTAEDAARLTAYGRAFLADRWVNAPDPEDAIDLQPDGKVSVSRKVSRYERFQLARFTRWADPATLDGTPYVYHLDADGIRQGIEQGITPANIQTFFQAVLKNTPLPPQVARLLETWKAAPPASGITLERHILLRTNSKETLDFLFNTPAFRQYFGARLGDTAVIVRGDQVELLRVALGENGITAEVKFS